MGTKPFYHLVAMGDDRKSQLTLLAFIAMVILAGGNAVAVKFTVLELPPFWGASLRFGAAAAILLALMAIRRVPWPTGMALWGAVIYGVLGFGAPFAFFYWGVQRASAGTGQVILACAPLLTVFLAFIHRLEPLRLRGILGSLVALAGFFVVFRDQLDANVPASSLIAFVLGAASFAETGVIVKLIPQGGRLARNTIGMAIGTGLLLLLSAITGEPQTLPERPETWIAIAYLVIGGSIAVFTLYLFVLKTWTASVTSYEFVLIPFVTVILGAWLLGEPLSAVFALGAVLVLAGVYLGALSGGKTERAELSPKETSAEIRQKS